MRIPIPGRRDQRGAGKIGPIIAILVAVAIIYLLAKMIPPRIERAEFQEFCERAVREAIVGGIPQDKMIDGIMAEAAKVGLPVKEENIRVADSEQRVRVEIDYTKKVELIGGKIVDQRFHVVADIPKI